MNDRFMPRQLCALAVTALAAPLVMVCAGISWPWVLLGIALAGAFWIYYMNACRGLPPQISYTRLLCVAWGAGGPCVLGLYWFWAVAGGGMAAALTVQAFPADRAFPLIPLVLLALAAMTADKGAAVVCRFGATLFLAVAALLAGALAFGVGDVQAENLRPAGEPGEAVGVLAVLLLPAAGLFLRDRMAKGRMVWGRWFAAAAGLAAAVSVVTVGALGLPMARLAKNPFWLMSRSISIFGIMERFEAVISALLAISACCLLALMLSAGRAALHALCPFWNERAVVWTTAAAMAACIWGVGYLPKWLWPAGNLLFWGIVPAITLGIVHRKKFEKIENNS